MARSQRPLSAQEKRLVAVIAVMIFVVGEIVFYAAGFIQGYLSAIAAGMFLGAFGLLLGAIAARGVYDRKR